MRRVAKREIAPPSTGPGGETDKRNADAGRTGRGKQDESSRRVLRSHYLAVKSRINGERPASFVLVEIQVDR